jgi:hypothetical protein
MTVPQALSDNKHLIIIGTATFLLIYLSSFVSAYGYFIDEFYYIACAAHPAFGYVDHPPLSPFILTLFQSLFGTSLYAIRVLPALALALTVVMTGIITKEIGGGKFAQTLAACSMAAAPMFIAFGGFYSMNAFEPLLAIALLYYTIRMIKENDHKRWIPIGIVMGLGMMNKHTFALFIIALIVSLLLAGKWRLVVNRWFIAGGLCGFMIFLPNIIWQMMNDYPSLEFYHNINTYKNIYTPPGAFLTGQLIGMSPSTVLVWFAGIIYLLSSRKMKDFRFLSILFLLIFFFMMYSGTSRSDRTMFAYPAVFAGGGLFFEFITSRYKALWLKIILLVPLFTGLVIALPIILPYFDYETVRVRTETLGMNTEIEKGKKPPLPQLLADRIGWEEKCELVNRVWQNLSPDEKKETIIAAGNYGDAGALELFGKKYNFPPVVSGHNTYYLWSKERLHASIVLQMDQPGNLERYKRLFEDVELTDGEYTSAYVSDHENHLRVYICRNPKIPLAEMLEKAKHFY